MSEPTKTTRYIIHRKAGNDWKTWKVADTLQDARDIVEQSSTPSLSVLRITQVDEVRTVIEDAENLETL
jgi:hypothetical protein